MNAFSLAKVEVPEPDPWRKPSQGFSFFEATKMQHYAGQYYHVYNRGVNRQPIFANEENYHFLLRRVKQFLPLYQTSIIAYSLMPNHYHFLVGVDQEGALSAFFPRLFNSYSQAFNRQQWRAGTLFEGRAKSIIVDESRYVYAIEALCFRISPQH
jgi:REP element-mobilizing transposase RayT